MSDLEPTKPAETPAQVTPAADPTAVLPEAAEPARAAGRRGGKGQWVTLSAALAVVLVAGGGLTWVAFGHQDAKPKPWAAPAPKESGSYGSLSGGIHYGKLGKLLLPTPKGWELGPDLTKYGNDTELSKTQAEAQFEAQYADGMTGSERRQMVKDVQKLGIKGQGLRSFQNEDTERTVQVQLVQINKQYAKESIQDLTRLLAAVASKGPKVPGHAEAHCFVDTLTKKHPVQQMYCLADEGDLTVTVVAEGGKPVGDAGVLTVIKDQLDRIADPGESV